MSDHPVPPAPAPAPQPEPAAAPAPAGEPTWHPYPGDPKIYLYGHLTRLRVFGEGWLRVLDADGTELVRVEGKGKESVVSTTFQSPEPEPGQPHVATVEISEGAKMEGYQHYPEPEQPPAP